MKKIPRGWLWFVFVLILGLLYGFFNNLYVTKGFSPLSFNLLDSVQNVELTRLPTLIKKELREVKGESYEALWLGGERIDIPFHIDDAQSLRLKIKGYFPSSDERAKVVVLFVNDIPFTSLLPRWSGEEEVFRLKVPRDFLSPGRNMIGLSVAGKKALSTGIKTLKVRNYLGKSSNFPRGFIIYDEGYARLGLYPWERPLDYLLFPLSLILLWLASANLMAGRKGKTLSDALRRSLYFNLPGAVVVLGALIFSLSTPYTVVTSPGTFWGMVFAPSAIIIFYYLLVSASRRIIGRSGLFNEADTGRIKEGAFFSKRMERVVSPLLYLAGKAGTLAISGFMVFLVTAGVLMIMNRHVLAERCADIAYFMLAFGVLMRLFDLKRTEDS